MDISDGLGDKSSLIEDFKKGEDIFQNENEKKEEINRNKSIKYPSGFSNVNK